MKFLTLNDWFMGRDKLYPEELTLDIRLNAEDLIRRVNNLFQQLQMNVPLVTSGWRPSAINAKVGGAKRSLHMIGKAVDLSDPDGSLGKTILEHPEYLLDYGLWLENPAKTKGWLHTDTGKRSERLIHVFDP